MWSLTSRPAWAGRSAYTIAEIILILGVDKVATETAEAVETILNIPSEFVPTILVLVLIAGVVVTFAKSIPKFYEARKDTARSKGEALVYGMDYLVNNVMSIILTVIASLVLTGWVIGEGIVDGSTLYNAAVTAVVIAIVAALAGDAFLTRLLEARRDKAKATEALSKKEQ